MYQGNHCIISWFGKLKNRFNVFEESSFMFPPQFEAVSKTFFFYKINKQVRESSLPRSLLLLYLFSQEQAMLSTYSAPDSVLSTFCGKWKKKEATKQQWYCCWVAFLAAGMLRVLVCFFHTCRFFRPSLYLPCEPFHWALCEVKKKKKKKANNFEQQ